MHRFAPSILGYFACIEDAHVLEVATVVISSNRIWCLEHSELRILFGSLIIKRC